MSSTMDTVWNTITDSAKTRFNYDGFVKSLGNIGAGTPLAENVLFLIIVGLADGQSDTDIAAQIDQKILPIGCRLDKDALCSFIANRRSDLTLEIKATDVALRMSEKGMSIPGVLGIVENLLAQPSAMTVLIRPTFEWLCKELGYDSQETPDALAWEQGQRIESRRVEPGKPFEIARGHEGCIGDKRTREQPIDILLKMASQTGPVWNLTPGRYIHDGENMEVVERFYDDEDEEPEDR